MMDTSKEYLEMCKKAEEIQNLYSSEDEWNEGDVYARWYEYHHYEGIYPAGEWIAGWTFNISGFDGEYGLDHKASNHIWLPRQDQLQEIVGLNLRKYGEDKQPSILQLSFLAIIKREYSFEQLWLAYVMKEKFNKLWQENSWVYQNKT